MGGHIIRRIWSSLSSASLCGSLVIFYDSKRVMQAGVGPQRMDPTGPDPRLGEICTSAMSSGKGNYLANMALFPGRVEFEHYLPLNTQGVVVQPIGNRGVIVAATGTVRGFSRIDQAWIALLADKLEVSLGG